MKIQRMHHVAYRCRDARETVEVSLARLVPEVLHLPFDHEQRIAIVRQQPRREVLLP